MADGTIRNPIEWSSDQLKLAASGMRTTIHTVNPAVETPLPAIRRIGAADLKDALAKGVADFAACRTDVMFLGIVYPVVGLVLWRLVFGQGMFQLLFPLASGFALVGPFLALGLYEMSRRREQGLPVSWADSFGALKASSSGAIALLGLSLLAIFILWLFAAEGIYQATIAYLRPNSMGAFINDVLSTGSGWAMIGIGLGVGFLFALAVLLLTLVSFPLLIDRPEAGLGVAIGTSVRAVMANKRTIALWGLIVAGGLVIGSIPLLLGLAFVVPVLGHATWHLYRKLVG